MDASTTAPPTWTKATRSSSSSSCVEVALVGEQVRIRDSKFQRDPRNHSQPQPTITVAAASWHAFLDIAAAGAEPAPGHPEITRSPDGGAAIHAGPVTLHYTPDEWAAFLDGISSHEFDLLRLRTIATDAVSAKRDALATA